MKPLTPWLESISTVQRLLSRRSFLSYLAAGAVIAACGDDGAGGTTTTRQTTTASHTTIRPPETTSPTTTELPQPEIAITFPSNGAIFCGGAKVVAECTTIDGPIFTFEGTVSPGAEVFTGQRQANVADGRWSIELILATGTFPYTFFARNPGGAEASDSVTVTYGELISDF